MHQAPPHFVVPQSGGAQNGVAQNGGHKVGFTKWGFTKWGSQRDFHEVGLHRLMRYNSTKRNCNTVPKIFLKKILQFIQNKVIL